MKWLACLALVLAGAAFGFEGGEVDPAELPPQARETLELIASGGPFPHVQDGRIFHNRERRLPLRRRGYYREYTVKTPGAPDRGARRIVAGEGGELYYTADHYRTFRRIRDPSPR